MVNTSELASGLSLLTFHYTNNHGLVPAQIKMMTVTKFLIAKSSASNEIEGFAKRLSHKIFEYTMQVKDNTKNVEEMNTKTWSKLERKW